MGSKDFLILALSCAIWLAMGIISAYCIYEESKNYLEFTRIMILVYFIIFAVIGLAFEARIGLARNAFTFLSTTGGKGVFLIFLGTLGISFGFVTSPFYRVLPSILGIACIVVALCLMVLGCLNKKKGDDAPPAGEMADVATAKNPAV